MTKYKVKQPLFITLVFSSALLLPQQGMAGIKCWTNKQGVRECGNTVPPEYAQKETRTVNQRGITTDVSKRAKTKKEIEAERASKEEEERRQAEEEKRREEQDRHDRVLLATFLTEEDIIRSRERKVNAIDASIELSRITIDKLKSKLEREQKRANGYEGKRKPVPESLQKDIDSMLKQVANKQSYIDSKEQEKQTLIEKYEADLERFRELKSEGRSIR